MSRKNKTLQEFIAEMSKVNPEIKILGQYVKAQIKIKVQHSCGHIWETSPDSLLHGKSCPKCAFQRNAEKRRMTQSQFVAQFNQVHQGKGYQVVGDYVDTKTKIAIHCVTHGVWKIKPENLLQGQGCPQCGIEQKANKLKSTQSEFTTQFNQVHQGKNYTVVGEYINAHTKIAIHCPIHDIWEATPNHLLQGRACPCCAKTGFHINQPATFYVYEIIKNKDIYYGFGITNTYDIREKRHLKNLTEAGANITNKWLYSFASGYECFGLERDVKAALTEAGLNQNLGVKGFITECAKEEAKNLIMRKIQDNKYIQAY